MSYSLGKASFDTPSPTAIKTADLLATDIVDERGVPIWSGEGYIGDATHEGEVGYGLSDEVGKLVVAASVDAIGQSPDILINHIVTAPDERRQGHARALLGIIAHEAANHPDVPGVNLTLNAVNAHVFEGMGFSYVGDPEIGDMMLFVKI